VFFDAVVLIDGIVLVVLKREREGEGVQGSKKGSLRRGGGEDSRQCASSACNICRSAHAGGASGRTAAADKGIAT
jgi:hypothetical protein